MDKPRSDLRLTFWGATETVTGSRFLAEVGGHRVLVDCGLFQGLKRLRERNWAPFPVDPSTIDAVVLTHAHIDHAGYLPALVRDGFRGQIWSTPGTADLSRILLIDSAHLHEEDARVANRRHSSRHHPARPLYTTADAERCLDLFQGVPFHERFHPVDGVEVSFSPVGHIIGAAAVRLAGPGPSVTFTGDVGRPDDLLMLPPEPPPSADHIVTESTYGNRSHPREDPRDTLARVVNRTIDRGGSLLVPVFAVGRAQVVLHLLAQLVEMGSIPDIPTYVNSPMATAATGVFCDHVGEHRLTASECRRMRDRVTFVESVEESKALTKLRSPMIVLAGSGMATGGRVLHHLERLAPNRRNTILFTGFQASGTRGEALVNGAQAVKIFGEHMPARAEVTCLHSLSAHADADQLLAWLATADAAPRTASIVHGEASAADTLRRRIRDELAWLPSIPEYGESLVVRPVQARASA